MNVAVKVTFSNGHIGLIPGVYMGVATGLFRSPITVFVAFGPELAAVPVEDLRTRDGQPLHQCDCCQSLTTVENQFCDRCSKELAADAIEIEARLQRT